MRHRRGGRWDNFFRDDSLAGAAVSATGRQYIEDVNSARIYAGFHYRSTLQQSNVLGRAVANWVNDHMMVPLDDDGEGGSDGHYQGQPVPRRLRRQQQRKRD